MGHIIGIDLGTTNSVVALNEGGEPIIIVNTQGNRTTPSVVGFNSNEERLVGQLGKRQAVQNPKNTIFSIKRFMGRRYKEVAEEEKQVPYEIKKGKSSDVIKVCIGDKEYTPPEISAFILADLKKSAEEYLGEEIKEAVITVPAYFNDAQRQATKDAGKIAGLEVKRIINEPTAAALAFGLNKTEDSKIAVFDFGGGTFDISILELSDVEGEQVFEVKSTNGNTRLGGDDIDEVLINYVADEFVKQHNIDLRKDNMALQRLKEACEKAKCELSNVTNTTISLPFITQAPEGGGLHLNMEISRAKFESICDDVFKKLVDPCKIALEDAHLTAEEIDEVVLVGGSTRIPKVKEIVKDLFKKEANKGINPDEVVALGAAVQASILEEPGKANITFLDVTPLSLGLEIEGGLMATLIEKNTTIPTQKKDIFSTAEDNQPSVDIHIYQGERPVAKDNRLLGQFKLDDIPPARRGVPQIEVSFDIDVNGILKVSAKDLGTQKEQKITIESSSGLTEKQIEKMQKEAEEYAQEDAKRKEEIEAKNEAEKLLYASKKFLENSSDSLEENDVDSIQETIRELEEAIQNNKNIKMAKEKLESVQSTIVEKMYAKHQGEEDITNTPDADKIFEDDTE